MVSTRVGDARITFIKALYSEKMGHRVLHGQFLNPKGGLGNNYANEFKMESMTPHM